MTPGTAMDQLLIPGVVLFFLVWGLIGAAIGAGLIVSSGSTLRLFGVMNRYVSTRHGLKPMAISHDVGQSVRKYRHLIGPAFVLGAAFSIYGLAARFDSAAIASALGLPYPRVFIVGMLDWVRWSLIVFNGLALIIGVMLACAPDALARFEAQMIRWYSFRALTAGADTMHLPLDRLVAAYPRSAGAIIAVAALAVAANAAALWLRFS
jgi:hypothetical protein